MRRSGIPLLKWGGTFPSFFRPERLADLFCALRQSGIEQKRIRFVEKQPDSLRSLLFWWEGRRGGRPGLVYEPPLVIFASDGRESEEMDRINFRQDRKAGALWAERFIWWQLPIGNLNDISPARFPL